MNIILFGNCFSPRKQPRTFASGVNPAIFGLANHLRDQGHDVRTVGVWEIDFAIFKEIIQSLERPDVVGVSTTLLYEVLIDTGQIDDLHARLSYIKDVHPSTRIVLGGTAVAAKRLAKNTFRKIEPLVDAFITGAGEAALDAYLTGKATTVNLCPPTISDLTYPDANFSTSQTVFSTNDGILPHDCLGIEYSRGCIFSCSFCDYALIGKKKGSYEKDISALKEQMLRNYYDHGTEYYYFTDSLLNDTADRITRLAEMSASLPFQLKFSAYLRLDLISRFPSMAADLRDAGLVSGLAGIETLNDASGKSVKKGLGAQRITETLHICHEAWAGRVGLMGSFILGLPHDTADTPHVLREWQKTDIVQKTLQDCHVITLRLIKDEITSKGYTVAPDGSWVNQNGYTSAQATADTARVNTEFYADKQLNVGFPNFTITQILAYAKQYGLESEVMDVYLNRKPTASFRTAREFYQRVALWETARQSAYLEHVHKYGKMFSTGD